MTADAAAPADPDIAARVAAVQAIDVVPRILEVVCRTTGLGFAAVAYVDEARWVACAVRDDLDFGLVPGGELPLTTTICNEIRQHHRPVIIDHVAEDADFRDHPTPAMYGFQSYISVPIFHRGEFFGTLCGIDPRPIELTTADTLATFELFADLIGRHLDVQARLDRSEAALLSERETAELREQFIAVLGHDLRNPLAAISGAAHLLRKRPDDPRREAILGQMEGSVGRMAGLIDNLMDLTRARLGAGLEIRRDDDAPVAAALAQVIDELRTGRPDQVIHADIRLDAPVSCDPGRIAQLASNLIANALTHGAPDRPVAVVARADAGGFTLSVTNEGPPIPAERIPRLFQPFTRAAEGPGQEGLGLGLYIASEIARAHGARLTAVSDPAATTFTLTMDC